VRRWAWFVLVASGIIVSCYAPTEVEIDVTTDVACTPKNATGIFLDGNDVSEGEAQGCAGDFVGSFVVSPHGARDAQVSVTVAMNTNGGAPHDCLAPQNDAVRKSCIVARRAFTFTPHASRYVAVRLYASCAGELCGPDTTCEPDQTGAGTTCKSANTDTTPDPKPPPPVDGGRPFDSGSDGPPLLDGGPVCGAVSPSQPDVLVPTSELPAAIAAVGNQIFWIEPEPTSAVLKGIGTDGTPVIFPPAMPKPITKALASDGRHLYFAASGGAVVYDVPTSAVTLFTEGVTVTSIGLGSGAFYFSTPSRELYQQEPNTLTKLSLWDGGDVVGSTATPSSILYVLDKSTSFIGRYQLPYPNAAPGMPPLKGSGTITTHDAGLYYVAQAGTPPMLSTLDEVTSQSTALAPAGNVDAIIFDADFVYYADNGSAAIAPGIYRTSRAPPAVTALPGLKLTSLPYGLVRGLALVGGCLYFGASDPTQSNHAIRVAPTRPVP
jgi:hypothetical protein